MTRSPSARVGWTLAITSVASFMTALDNLVVTNALPSIRAHLHAGLASLEWTVNAYTLSFAVLILTGAALGDRFGRRRMFMVGLTVFTVASAGAALAPSIGVLTACRAVQGAGAAAVMPLTFTILSAAVPAERRGAMLGFLGAVSGLAVAVGPLVGGLIVQSASWQWIFWINVPIGLALLPFARARLEETRAQARLDLPGVVLAGAGLFGVVLGLVRASDHGWTNPMVFGSLVAGSAFLLTFVAVELRSPAPMLPLRLFGNRQFAAANGASLLFSFGMFGSIFLLAQFLQTVMHLSPLAAGVRMLPWTMMPLAVAPLAGPLSDRIGGRPLLVAGLTLQATGLAWIGLLLSTSTSFVTLVAPFVCCGAGMALFFVPVTNEVLGSVRPAEEGVASGANNAIRELGGVLGIAVLATVFSAHGSYATTTSFTDGLRPATFVGAGVVLAGGLVATALPRRRPAASRAGSAAAAPAARSAA